MSGKVIKMWLLFDYVISWLPCDFGVFGKVIKEIINWLQYRIYSVTGHGKVSEKGDQGLNDVIHCVEMYIKDNDNENEKCFIWT